MGSSIVYQSSDPRLPSIEVHPGCTFNAEELENLKGIFTAKGFKVEKVGPIRLPWHLSGEKNIHFVIKAKGGKSTPVIFYMPTDKDPIGLELLLGQMALWGKFGSAPVIVYSIMKLPDHFKFYLSESPMARIELGLRVLYITDLLPYIIKGLDLRKAEFIASRVQDLIKSNLPLSFKITDWDQNIACLNEVLFSLRHNVPDRNDRMKNNLEVATKMLAFHFGKCLRFETNMQWTTKDRFEPADQVHILLTNGWLLDPYQIVKYALDNNIPLQNIYKDLKSTLQGNLMPSFARRPTPKKREYIRKYLPAGTPEIVRASIGALIMEYSQLGLFQGSEWRSEEMLKEYTKRITDEWADVKELPEYLYLHQLNQIHNFDTEDSEDPDNMASLARDIFMLSKGDLIPSYFELDYDDPNGRYEIIRFGLGTNSLTVVSDRDEGEIAVIEFVDCLNVFLENRGIPKRYFWLGFTDDQTACLAYLETATAQKLLWTKGWPIKLNQPPFDMVNYWLKYARILGFLSQMTLPDFRKRLEHDVGINEKDFIRDPGKVLTEQIVDQDGIGIDHRFTSDDVVFNANKLLKTINIEIGSGDPEGNGDEVVDQASHRRKARIHFDGQPHEFEYETPTDVIQKINALIASKNMEFLEKEIDCDTYEYILVTKKNAQRLLMDRVLRFNRVADSAESKSIANTVDPWSDYIR